MNPAQRPPLRVVQPSPPPARAECQCAGCYFHHVATLRCRRRAPVVVATQHSAPEYVWPRVQAQDWCGEWRAA